MTRPAIVFTDLDGTLLDHESYAFDAAKPALSYLRERGIPLILASSKTAAEIEDVRAETGFADCPAIVENGGGILEAAGAGDTGADRHRELLDALDGLPSGLRAGFSGFSEWSVADLARRTGLSESAAAKAADRRFSEPGTWNGTDAEREEFVAQLAKRGISARRGGRYLTLSFGDTKADRMAEIATRYARGGEQPFIIALGDAPNDIEMLESADIGVIVANPHGSPLPPLDAETSGRIIRTEKPGPDGWNDAVLRIFRDL